ncbi:MAG: CHRD domain-containing protein [Phycisphaerales bacterium]
MRPFLTACAAGAALLAADLAGAMGPPPAHNFIGAPMSGANEVPPVETCAEGATQVKYKNGVLTFKVNVEDIDDVVAAHLHFGKPGENGPVLVTLYEAPPPPPENARYDDDDDDHDDDYDNDEDTLAFGAISDDDVEDVEGVTFADGSEFDGSADGLLRLLREGSIYVNVHTALNPSGEIRAQLRGNGTGGPNPNRGNGDLCDDDDDKDCDDDCDCDCECDDDGDSDVDCDDARRGDLNGDGVIDEKDLRILLDNFTTDNEDASSDDDDEDEAPRRRGRRGMIPVGR